MDKLVIAALVIFVLGAVPLLWYFRQWVIARRRNRPLPDWIDREKWKESMVDGEDCL